MQKFDVYLTQPEVDIISRHHPLSAVFGTSLHCGFIGLSYDEEQMRWFIQGADAAAAVGGRGRIGSVVRTEYRDTKLIAFEKAEEIAANHICKSFAIVKNVSETESELPCFYAVVFIVRNADDGYGKLFSVEVDKLNGHIWSPRQKLEFSKKFAIDEEYELAAFDLAYGEPKQKLSALTRLESIRHPAKEFMMKIRFRHENDAEIKSAIGHAIARSI